MNESRLGYILQGGYILGGVDPYNDNIYRGRAAMIISIEEELQ